MASPDAGGEYVERHVALGHLRLAIIDLAGGTQGITRRRYWSLSAREHEDDLPRTIATVTGLLEHILPTDHAL